MFRLKEFLGSLLHRAPTTSLFGATAAMVSGDLAPNKCEIERGVFFAPAVIDGWTSARPDDFAPGFLECWKAYRRKMHSEREQSIRPETFSAANGAASTA